jgi:hypothetical protein
MQPFWIGQDCPSGLRRDFQRMFFMSRRGKSENAGRHLAWLFGGLALAGVCYYGVTHYSRPQVVAQATADRPPALQDPARATVNAHGQASPQGPTGPLETKSGGAPAASPQGDTPSGMQAVPEKPDETTSRPSK